METNDYYQKIAEDVNLISANGGIFFIATRTGNEAPIFGRLEKMEVKENLVSIIPKNSFLFVKEFLEIPTESLNWIFSVGDHSGFLTRMPSRVKGASHTVKIQGVAIVKIFSNKQNFVDAVAEKIGVVSVEEIPKEVCDVYS